jgi:CTP:molybdopterin cytidylyltransferase MocA
VTGADPAGQPVLILGAGHGTRMGGPKVFALHDGITFLEHILRRVADAQCPAILTVDPLFRKRVEELLSHMPDVSVCLVDADGKRPMLASVQAGIGALSPMSLGLWLWPVDAPLLSSGSWREVRALVAGAPDVILKLRAHGRTGHPTWFPRWACDRIRAGSWENGLLGFLAEMSPQQTAQLELPGETLTDFNTPDQLAALRR